MEEQTVESEEVQPQVSIEPDLDMNYAGFWARFFAYILDLIILGIGAAIILYLSYDMIIESSMAIIAGQPIDLQRTFVNSMLTMIVTVVFWKLKGATPGKMMMGLTIVDAKTGEPPSIGMLVLRYFAYFASMIPLFLGFIWIAFDKRNQGFHDKIARTVVIVRSAKDDVEAESEESE